MDETTIKHAFRTAYDFVEKHRNPQFTKEYFTGVLDEVRAIRDTGQCSDLLECLLIGVYEYLGREAKANAGK